MHYQLLIFDWDGTLSDSAAQIVNSMQAAIRGLNLPPREDEKIRELIGLGLNEGLQILYPEMEMEGLRRLLDGFRKQWLTEGLAPGEAPLFAGALEAMLELHNQGYRLSVATGKARRGLDRSLKHHIDVHRILSSSRCADETANKPDPLMLRELLAHEDLQPEQALMIGDTEYDMAMAAAIGMPALGVACGVHTAERMLKAGAQAVISDVRALPSWLADKAAKAS